jgi:hypothetical protein
MRMTPGLFHIVHSRSRLNLTSHSYLGSNSIPANLSMNRSLLAGSKDRQRSPAWQLECGRVYLQ